MDENKKDEILRLDIRLKGKDRENFLKNMQELKFKKYPDYIRTLANRKFIYIFLYQELIKHFWKQGNNLNQIARHINEEKAIADSDRELLEDIRNTYKEILERVKNL